MATTQSPQLLSRLEYIVLMSVIVAVDALAIDAILPALSFIGEEFQMAPNQRQHVVISLFVGYAIGVMIYGIVSDSFGRKRPIYAGFALFLVGTLVTIFAGSYEVLLLGRVLQGMGAAGPQIIPTAITRDIYKGRGMAEIMSLIMMVFMVVPAIGPLIGQSVLLFTQWQGIFWLLAIYALLALIWFAIRQPETLPPEKRVPFSLPQIWTSVKVVLRNNQALKYTLTESLAFTAILTYLSTAQQVFQDHYGLGEEFALYFGGLALVMMVAAFVNSRLVGRYGMRFLVTISAAVLFIVSALVFASMQWAGLNISLWGFMGYASVAYFCLGILFGNMHSLAMEQVGEVAGVAASVIGSVSTLIATVLAAIIGSYYQSSILPIVASFAILMLPVFYIGWHDLSQNGRHHNPQKMDS